MPNWCYCNYTATGNVNSLKDMKKLFDKVTKRKTSLVKNGFGPNWLGNIVESLGVSYEMVYCRGTLEDYEFNKKNGHLTFHIEFAWGEATEFRHFLEAQFPGIKIYYQAEEGGNGYYETNDIQGEYYPERYWLDSEINEIPSDWFDDEPSLCEYVKKYTGIESTNAAEAQNAIESYLEGHPDISDEYCTIHEYSLNFDD